MKKRSPKPSSFEERNIDLEVQETAVTQRVAKEVDVIDRKEKLAAPPQHESNGRR